MKHYADNKAAIKKDRLTLTILHQSVLSTENSFIISFSLDFGLRQRLPSQR
jgi:hypothetical protein